MILLKLLLASKDFNDTLKVFEYFNIIVFAILIKNMVEERMYVINFFYINMRKT